MSKSKSIFACSVCGHTVPRWQGRCDACDTWNSYQEETARPASEGSVGGGVAAMPFADVAVGIAAAHSTGIDEFDRVLGGGLVTGSVTLVGGEPGIGKSTLLAQVAAIQAQRGDHVLYVSAEESPHQISRRLQRLGRSPNGLWIGGEPNIEQALIDLDTVRPSLVVIDSIQTVFDPVLTSAPGSVAQVRHCAHRLARIAKERSVAVVLVGQVTKDGGLAGPRVLEHLVDTVISFEGDRDLGLRLLRANKHRFGPTGVVGAFEMTNVGLVEVADPSSLLLSDRRGDVPGSVIAVTAEGARSLVVEVQALVTDPAGANPRRFAQGIDQNRVAMLLAILAQRGGVRCIDRDVYASVVGGLRLGDPGADLAIVLAIASAAAGVVVDAETVVMGELGLAGEVRSVSGLERRLGEAARLGFRRAVVPPSAVSELKDNVSGIHLVPVATVGEALGAVGVVPVDAPSRGPRRDHLAVVGR